MTLAERLDDAREEIALLRVQLRRAVALLRTVEPVDAELARFLADLDNKERP